MCERRTRTRTRTTRAVHDRYTYGNVDDCRSVVLRHHGRFFPAMVSVIFAVPAIFAASVASVASVVPRDRSFVATVLVLRVIVVVPVARILEVLFLFLGSPSGSRCWSH